MNKTDSRSKTERHKKGPLKEPRNIVLGVKVSHTEFERWKQRYMGGGRKQSDVMRDMLQIEKAARRRTEISREAQWDYARATLIRTSVSRIQLQLKSVLELSRAEREEAYRNSIRVVKEELKRIGKELNALQTRGWTKIKKQAVTQSGDWEEYFLAWDDCDDC